MIFDKQRLKNVDCLKGMRVTVYYRVWNHLRMPIFDRVSAVSQGVKEELREES